MKYRCRVGCTKKNCTYWPEFKGVCQDDCPNAVLRPKPEPEQDERIREAFEKKLTELLQGSKPNQENIALMKIMYGSGYTDGYTSQNAEIEALKAEIKSMRCCGNCQHLDYCEYHDNQEAEREINYPFDRCNNWSRKNK